MQAIVYSDGTQLRCIARGYSDFPSVDFSARGRDSRQDANELPPPRDALPLIHFDFAINDGKGAQTLHFERLGHDACEGCSMVDGIFEKRPERLNTGDCIYAKALSLCPSPQCVIIEDSIAGINAIKEAERSGFAKSYAIERPDGQNPEKDIPSVMAWVGDIERFCELIGLFRRYGNW